VISRNRAGSEQTAARCRRLETDASGCAHDSTPPHATVGP
jgi:hypothetical protein